MRIAVPMMGKEAETLMRQARAIAAHPGVDMAEWRADALERALTPDAVCAIPARFAARVGRQAHDFYPAHGGRRGAGRIMRRAANRGAVRRALDRRGGIALPGCGGVDCPPACPGLPGDRLAP